MVQAIKIVNLVRDNTVLKMAENTTTAARSLPSASRMKIMYTSFLRDVCAAGIVITSVVPETSRWFIFLPVILFWFLFALLSGSRAFYQTFIAPDIKAYSIYFWLFMYFVFYFAGYMQGAGIERMFNYLRLGSILLFFNYYLHINNLRTVRRLTVFSLICIVFVAISTLRGLALDPMAARLLATGMEDLMLGLTGMMIGSYGFIYGLVFVVVAIVGLIRTSPLKKQTIVLSAIAALAIYTIFSAAFTIALLILTIALVLLLLNIKKISWTLVVASISFMVIQIMSPIFYGVLFYLGDIVEFPVLSERIHSLAYLVKHGNFEGSENMTARWEFLLLSAGTFLNNPILGVGGFYGFGTSQLIGGHAGFLDELAKYGIIGTGFLFVALYSNARFIYRRLKNSKQKIVYHCSMSAFFILGVINTFLFVPLLFMAYFVVPGIILSFYKSDFDGKLHPQ